MEYYYVKLFNLLSIEANYLICVLYIANKYGFISNETKFYLNIYKYVINL